MSLNDALFLIQRGEFKFKVRGDELNDKMQPDDMVLVQRGTNKFKATYDGSGYTTILDDDLLLVQYEGNKFKVSGTDFLSLFGAPPPPTPEEIKKCKQDAYSEYAWKLAQCESDYCKGVIKREFDENIESCELTGTY